MNQAAASTITENQSNEQATIARMQDVLAKQQKAFLEEGYVSAETRIDRLTRAYKMIGENQDAIIEACCKDFGNRSNHQSRMADVLSVMDGLQYNIKNVKKWMKDEKRQVMFPLNLMGCKAKVINQPKGVVGNISTWNFPVHVAIIPLGGIFAAGNRAMVKLSEVTPHCADLMEKLIAQYFDESECVGIKGGPEVGAAFSALPFDHIIFTGATGIGRHILHAAADNLTPVTLELGGKSPVIVGRSYDLDKAAQRIITGKSLNMGQVCLSPDYAFVPKEGKDQFVKTVVAHFSELFPTVLSNPDVTSVVNARHQARLLNVIEDARTKGAEVVQINPANEDFSNQPDGIHKIPMTMIIDPSEDMLAMQEELFGPVICIKTYEQVHECIQYINARPRPLGLYYFGEDKTEETMVLQKTISGGVAINDVLAHVSCEELPFGGVGASGMGNYHGRDGYITFSHQKAVYRQTKLDIFKLAGMLPPYGEKCEKQLDKLCKVK